MTNYLSALVLCITILASSDVYAHQISLNLAPNGSKTVTNSFGWTLNARCTVKTKSKNKIRVSVLENKGSVNGKSLATGQATSVVVEDQDAISVSVEPGTRVTLQNLSEDPVQASCAT